MDDDVAHALDEHEGKQERVRCEREQPSWRRAPGREDTSVTEERRKPPRVRVMRGVRVGVVAVMLAHPSVDHPYKVKVQQSSQWAGHRCWVMHCVVGVRPRHSPREHAVQHRSGQGMACARQQCSVYQAANPHSVALPAKSVPPADASLQKGFEHFCLQFLVQLRVWVRARALDGSQALGCAWQLEALNGSLLPPKKLLTSRVTELSKVVPDLIQPYWQRAVLVQPHEAHRPTRRLAVASVRVEHERDGHGLCGVSCSETNGECPRKTAAAALCG
eukprot:6908020-Prymnesium_polylepis.1